METRRAEIYFHDECPRIGSGLRVVNVQEGDKWAYVEANGRKQRIPLELWDKLEADTERMRGH